MIERYDPEKTVFVDMDGVIADFDGEALRRMRVRYPDFMGDLERASFYIADDYPDYADRIREVTSEKGFFRAFPLVEGAIEGWQRIIDAGYEPRVLSSPLRSNRTSEEEKREWLAEHLEPIFGDHVASDAIITKDKHLHDGVALIDDRPEVAHADQAMWSHVVMSHLYNEHIDTDLRLRGWRDPELERILGVAKERYLRKLGATAL